MKKHLKFRVICALAVLLVAAPTLSPSSCEAKTAKKKQTNKPAAKTSKRKADPALAKTKTPEYLEAQVALLERKYKDAAQKFEKLDAEGACCETTHYYLAQCYQGMNQTVQAQTHYQWVAYYGKDPTLKQYATVAYNQLAYYQNHRTYKGQGNNFNRYKGGGAARAVG